MPAKSTEALARKREWRKRYDHGRKDRRSKSSRRKRKSHSKPSRLFIVGIDGEGVGRAPHRYVMLTAAGNRPTSAALKYAASHTLEDKAGLSTDRCLEFLLRLPRHALVVGFSFGYDWTKILEDLDNRALYQLDHLDDRDRYVAAGAWGSATRFKPVRWGRWEFDKRGTLLRFRKHGQTGRRKQWRKVWDVFRFFGKSFVWAIGPNGWNIATEEELAFIAEMKDKRDCFTVRQRKKIRKYNVLECRLLARLFEAVLKALDEVGLPIKVYYGPGSIASKMFEVMVGRKYFKELAAQAKDFQPELKHAIASAFFGGRFEHRIVGEIKNVWDCDINSAYPAEIAKLPCLLHGRWVHVNTPMSGVPMLVRYKLRKTRGKFPWGPFPFRHDDGGISFPIESGGGWVHGVEFWAARKIWKNIVFVEAWAFVRNCKCSPPFTRIAEWYAERHERGKKTGPGIVLKHGMNSGYGKLAQSIGRAPFNSWYYAGLITAGTRAKIIELIGRHKDPRNLYGIATDGVVTSEDFGFGENERLGEWSAKKIKSSWLVKPGVAFGEKPASRGIGSKALATLEAKAKRYWNRHHDLDGVVMIPKVTRFVGLKMGTHKRKIASDLPYSRSPKFGTWYDRPQVVSFSQMPKRERFEKGSVRDLEVRRLPLDLESEPYSRALSRLNPDAVELENAQREAEDQPDWGSDE